MFKHLLTRAILLAVMRGCGRMPILLYASWDPGSYCDESDDPIASTVRLLKLSPHPQALRTNPARMTLTSEISQPIRSHQVLLKKRLTQVSYIYLGHLGWAAATR